MTTCFMAVNMLPGCW